jgi:hypothetical protein
MNDVQGRDLMIEGLVPTVEDLVEDLMSTVQMTKCCLRLAFIHNYTLGV